MTVKKPKKSSVLKRLKARVKRKVARPTVKPKKQTMAYGRSRKRFGGFRNPFKRRQSFRQRPRSFSRSRSRGGGGGFNRRMPITGWKIPSLFIWLAIIGGGLYFGKDAIGPLIKKFKHEA
jgi:hypothetical protein